MKCPECGSKNFHSVDWGRTFRQLSHWAGSPLAATKIARAVAADHVAKCHRCARCEHRFARCERCHEKWPTTGREEIGDSARCPGCHKRVYYVGKFW